MISAHNLSTSYNLNTILEDVSFNINTDDRVGLIGPNGCGKSTLLKILIGEIQPDQGNVTYNPPDLNIGYLPQSYEFPPQERLTDVLAKLTLDSTFLEHRLASLADSIGKQPENKDIQDEYDSILKKLEVHDPAGVRPEEIIHNLGLDDIPDGILISQLSGGQKTRLGLAKILLREPGILILDEPTNHLDIETLEWLEVWIGKFSGGVLIVSHDRTFLDNTVTTILDLDPGTHSLRKYPGNYSQYLDQFINNQDKQMAAYRDQIYEIRNMKQDIAKTKNQAYRVELTTTSREPNIRRYAKKVARKAKSREKKLARYMESEDRIEKPGQTWQMKVDLSGQEHHSQNVARFEKLSAGYQVDAPLITKFTYSIKYGDRIALTGPNGSGKTTLLRTIAGQIEPLSGLMSLGSNIDIGYLAQEQESLSNNLNALETIQREGNLSETDTRSFLHYFLFSGDDVFIPINSLSQGEKARLQLAALIVRGCDFLLLDEPINHLDIPSRTQFEQALSQFKGTILAVVHDRYFIQRFARETWTLDDSGRIKIN